jgi:hypothetical protein
MNGLGVAALEIILKIRTYNYSYLQSLIEFYVLILR